MSHSYRITKYFNSDANGNLISDDHEWTGFSDVGAKVSQDEYLEVEKTYLDILILSCNHLHVKQLQISDLEDYDNNSSVVDGQLLTIEDASVLASKILREEIWCKLISPDIEFHFGYDFYMYLVAKVNLSMFFISSGLNKTLHIQEFKSPYL
jgi:hypothetical protein